MKSAITKTTLDPNAASVFVPMEESQMASAKGGDDAWQSEEFNQLILDWINEQTQDPDSIVSQILANFVEPPTMNDTIWGQIGDALEEEGVAWPSAEEIEDSLFMGGLGGF